MGTHPWLIDRDDLVLVVIDVQERLADTMERRDTVVSAASRLIEVCALVGAPIIVTRQYPKGLSDTVKPLADTLAEVVSRGAAVSVIDKTAFCACDEPVFSETLEDTNRGQVAIVGMETHICVVQTALDLLGEGYRVQVVADACCSANAEDHAVTLDRLTAAGVVVTTSQSVMYEAVGAAATDEFRALLGIVKGL